jgi:hypothetical protein
MLHLALFFHVHPFPIRISGFFLDRCPSSFEAANRLQALALRGWLAEGVSFQAIFCLTTEFADCAKFVFFRY